MTAGGGLSYDRFETGSSEEWMMRIGPADRQPLLFLPPLFEEMNRTRAFLASIMRALAGRGFGCWLPDLPGTGESEKALETLCWDDWIAAARDAAEFVSGRSGKSPIVASIRGGTLLDHVPAVPCRWRFAPAVGASLARDLVRASMVSQEELGGSVVELAGYPVPEGLLSALRTAAPAPAALLRTVRLESDRGEADLKLAGPSLWRRSEPANAPDLAQQLASDIADWAGRCAVS